ncbi:MAG TPA: hypothetical protein VL332_02250 [Candidatus Saccharimonadaceae bacterium]|jgi:hypothetical protein|nr:hypothetical protein [Candidatus Saccharimonadaceae bacterium]
MRPTPLDPAADLPASADDVLVLAHRAALYQTVARGLTHALNNAAQALALGGAAGPGQTWASERLTLMARVLERMARPEPDERGPVIVRDVLASVVDWQRLQTGLPAPEVKLECAADLAATHARGERVHQAMLGLVTQFKIECGRHAGPFVLSARNGHGGLAITLTSQAAPASGGPADGARTPVEAMLAAGARVAAILVARDGGSLEVEGSAEIGRRCEVLLPTWAVTPGRTAG